MKKFNLFWKIMLIVLPLTTSAIFGILAWKLYQRVYGRDYTERYSYGLDKVYYQNYKVRILNTQTMRFTTPKLNWITDYKETDSLTVFCYEGKRGYMSLYDGKITIPAQYQAAWMFSEGVGAVIKDNKLGFINSEGKEVIPFQFSMNPLPGERVDFLFKKGIAPCSIITKNMV